MLINTIFNTTGGRTMDNLKNMVDYIEDNQSKIDDEIKDNKKASEIWQQMEDLKNNLEDIIINNIVKKL